MKKKIIIVLLIITCFFITSSKASASSYNIKAGIVTTSGGNLNVRSNPSTSASIIGKIKNSNYLTIIRQEGSWYYVEYLENNFGYVHKDYINVTSSNAMQVKTQGGNLNVRSGPSTSYSIIESISNNDYVIVLQNSSGWAKVLFEGNKTGYVSNTYLKSNEIYPAKKLNVVSFKQYDSRWANNIIGNSNKTIKQSGCLLTSMAMSESYRKSTTITPPIMMKSLSFTSSGDMYWPSNYTQSTSSNYLTIIYNQLKQGKPVILGAKTKSGSQHWVLVYGYNGGNTLTPSGFLIHDPGSDTRSTLAHLFDSYPNFYKIAYYN
ncbi:MAG: SH3 domain-containing protein [Anaeroplasma sp.]